MAGTFEFRLNLVENISAALGGMDRSFTQIDSQVNTLNSDIGRLPNSIADLRGELSILREKRDFAHSAREVEEYNRKIRETEKQLGKLENMPPKSFLQNLKELGSQMGITFGVASISIAAMKLKEFVGASITAFDEQEKALAQVASSIQSTGGAAGRTLEQLNKQASDLQKKTLFGDEATLGAQSVLLTFTAVRGVIFDQAIPAIADLSTKMGTDLTSATQMVGKALNDPTQGITALKRAGVQMSDEQEASIKKLVKMGKMQEAQQMIINELQTQFGGSAQAAALAGMGPMEQLNNIWGDFQEQVGGSVVQIINGVVPAIKWTVGLIGDNYQMITSLAIGLSVATGAWALFAAGSWVAAGGIGKACVAITTAIVNIPIIGWVAGAIAAVVALTVYFYKTSNTFRAFMDGIWGSIKALGGFCLDIFGGIGKMIKGVFTLDQGSISAGMEQIKKAGADMGNAYTAAYNKSLTESTENQQGKDETNPQGSIAQRIDAVGTSGTTGAGDKVRNITINIDKLIDKFEIHTTHLQQDISRVKEMVSAVLLDAVNDVNMVGE